MSGIVVGRARLVALTASFGAGAAVAAGRLLRLIPGGRATRETEALDGGLDQLVRLGSAATFVAQARRTSEARVLKFILTDEKD